MSLISRSIGVRAGFAVTGLLAALAPAGPAGAGPASPAPTSPAPPVAAGWTVTDLGAPGTGDRSAATGINNAGVVVGSFAATPYTEHAFRWSAGTMTDLGVEAAGSSSFASAVNDAGQVAGTVERTPGGGFGYPARWSAAGVLQDLGGADDRFIGGATAIDPAGRVVGSQRQVDDYSDSLGFGYLWDAAGRRTALGPGVRGASGINSRGQVIGNNSAYVWQNGAVSSRPAGLPGATGPDLFAINVQGTLAGRTGSGTDLEVAAIWPAGSSTPVALGALGGIKNNTATAINAAGQVVGTSDPGCGPCTDEPTTRAWLYSPGGALTDLNTLLPAGSGWILNQATGINDRGQIVGAGRHDGHTRAYLLTPAVGIGINFGPAGAAVPAGYQADTGGSFGARAGGLSYGWNLDNSANTRDRNSASSPDQRYDTVIHLQRPGSATRWELALPNGRYLVHLVGGDPGYTDSTYALAVEGSTVLTGRPAAARPWLEASVPVTVADGRLTVTNAAGSSNNKLDYLDVVSLT